jgi:hypothetical protein
LRPAHELILLARVPGPVLQVDIEAGRIPWRDAEDRAQVRRIDTLRAAGRRRGVYARTLNKHGRTAFAASDGGRWPRAVMPTGDGSLGETSHVFVVPKFRNVIGHCSKPIELLTHLPSGGVVLDPFAGSGPLATAVDLTARKGSAYRGGAVPRVPEVGGALRTVLRPGDSTYSRRRPWTGCHCAPELAPRKGSLREDSMSTTRPPWRAPSPRCGGLRLSSAIQAGRFNAGACECSSNETAPRG